MCLGADPFELFAVTDATRCAEDLSYGPATLTEASAAYFSTAHKDVQHRGFKQILAPYGDPDPNNNAAKMVIDWYFSTTKTLKERWLAAVSGGEPCTWVIQYRGSTYTKQGTWWFSSGAGSQSAISARFEAASTSCCFSSDDALYGGGTGDVDGEGAHARPADFFGHGNYHSSDSSECNILYAGSSIASTTYSDLKNFMYLSSFPTGEVEKG